MVDTFGEVFGKTGGVGGLEGALGLLIKLDEETGFIRHHDFLDTADSAGDDGGLAGHGLQIDDAKGLIDGRAAEDAGMGIHDYLFRHGQHGLNPDDTAALHLGGGDGGLHLGEDLGCIGCSGTEYDLEAGVHALDGADEVDDALLAGDAADEEDVGDVWVHAVLAEDVGGLGALVFVGVDAVVDDMDLVRIDVEEAHDIDLRFLGHGDDGIGHLDGGLFQPTGEVVAAAELLALPGAEGLQGMDGEDHGNAVVELGEDATEVGIPSVEMNDLGVDVAGVEVQVALEGAKDGLEVRGTGPFAGIQSGSVNSDTAFYAFLITEAADLHLHEFGEFAGEVFHMHACAAIDVRGEFVGEKERLHGGVQPVYRDGGRHGKQKAEDKRGKSGCSGRHDRQISFVTRLLFAIIRARFMDAAIVIGLLIIAVILFATEKISVDLVTLALLCVLVLSGIITANEAFTGFGNDVIVMLGAIFVIGAALRETGVLDSVGHVLARTTGGHPKRIIAGMMTTVGGISAFMNNTTVTAMFLGPVIGLARRLNISPSRLLMPLAFSSILGGTCTLIGTSTNVAVSGALVKLGMEPVGMFEITPIGLVLFGIGLLYMIVIGTRWLPERNRAESGKANEPIREYLCDVVILPGSPIIGQEVYASDFSVMEFQVLKIRRSGVEIDVSPHQRLLEGDVVLVAGKVQNLIRVKKIEGIDILEDMDLRSSGVDMKDASIAEVVLTPNSSLVGQSLRSSNFRRRSGLSVLALLRGDRTLNDHMADVAMQAGDMMLLQGPYDRIRVFEEESEMVVISEHAVAHNAQKRGIAVLIVFAIAVLLSSLNIIPTSIAFLLVALIALATRCMTLDAAYENVDWRMLILIGGMTAFGTAMANSGADQMLADLVLGSLQPFGVLAVLAGFSLLTVLLTQPMSNAAAALVILPVALKAAESLHANPRTFAMAVMLSASISLITPFEPSCILVYGPGKYRFSDFIKVGGGLTVLTMLVILLLVPVFWPL